MPWLLSKYLTFCQGAYFAIGLAGMPACAQWFQPSMATGPFVVCVASTLVGSSVAATLVYKLIRDLFLRLIVTGATGVVATIILFPLFDESPFVLAILGLVVLVLAMQLFGGARSIAPHLRDDQLRRWLEVVLTLFAMFASSMMVGFTIGWHSLYGEALKGNVDERVVRSGINANLVITMYFWLGAGLLLLTGIKQLWFGRIRNSDSSFGGVQAGLGDTRVFGNRQGPVAAGRRMSARQAAWAVLSAAEGAMNSREVASAVLASGHETRARDFHKQLRAVLRSDPRIIQLEDGRFIIDSA